MNKPHEGEFSSLKNKWNSSSPLQHVAELQNDLPSSLASIQSPLLQCIIDQKDKLLLITLYSQDSATHNTLYLLYLTNYTAFLACWASESISVAAIGIYLGFSMFRVVTQHPFFITRDTFVQNHLLLNQINKDMIVSNFRSLFSGLNLCGIYPPSKSFPDVSAWICIDG